MGPNQLDIAALIKRILSKSTKGTSPTRFTNNHITSPTTNNSSSATSSSHSNDFVLYVGDNSTASKSLFEKSMGNNENESLRGVEVVTALVGKKTSQATFYLKTSNEVVDLMDSLASGFFVF